MLGFFIGCVWFVFVTKFVLKTRNPIKRVLNILGLKNNLSDDKLYDLNFDGEIDGVSVQKLLELTSKHDELTRIKNDLKKFTASLQASDIINKMGSAAENSKKNN
jgi:hypothetical protein